MTRQEEVDLIDKHIEQLGEHFDTIQVLCTRHESGLENGTVHVDRGAGNWFARYGQMRQWIIKEDEAMRE